MLFGGVSYWMDLRGLDLIKLRDRLTLRLASGIWWLHKLPCPGLDHGNGYARFLCIVRCLVMYSYIFTTQDPSLTFVWTQPRGWNIRRS